MHNTMRASIIAAILTLATIAHAQPPSRGWATHANKLSRVLVAEADDSVRDWTAILWTLEHRRAYLGISHSDALSYSATVRLASGRSRRIHTLPLRDMLPARAEQVRKARAHIRAWLAGRVADPCPNSLHWRGPSDPDPLWFVPLQCGRTNNIFGTAMTKKWSRREVRIVMR